MANFLRSQNLVGLAFALMIINQGIEMISSIKLSIRRSNLSIPSFLCFALLVFGMIPRNADAGNLEMCNAIDCRASEISAGLLTGPWKQACRKSEEAAIAYCHQSGGQIKHVCQAVCPKGLGRPVATATSRS